jgi:hypothetical protein
LVGITVNFDDDIDGANPPHFFSIQSAQIDDKFVVRISDIGTIKSVYSKSNLCHIYRCTAFFTLSINIPVAVETMTPPDTGSIPARVKFTLNSVRVYGIAAEV